MNLLADVYNDYRLTARTLVRVPGKSSSPSLEAIKRGLPNFFKAQLATIGLGEPEYRCYGGHGEINRTFAKIPWVACCMRSVASTVKDGYFIVILFREDMRGCWLSLNQGFTQYENAYANTTNARKQAQLGALTIGRMIDLPSGFVAGPISLEATTDLGMGYQAGAIASRYYDATNSPAEHEVAQDFLALLRIYRTLSSKVGQNAVALLPDSEGAFQAAAASLASSPAALSDLPPGPILPQIALPGKPTSSWRRNPKVAAIAINKAKNLCEADGTHLSFTSRATRNNFVEAHHLIPIGKQPSYKYSLDVPENVIALCPNCHRMIHHGLAQDRIRIASKFLADRLPLLKKRDIIASEADIKEWYRLELDED